MVMVDIFWYLMLFCGIRIAVAHNAHILVFNVVLRDLNCVAHNAKHARLYMD